jgi:hypothetical protein
LSFSEFGEDFWQVCFFSVLSSLFDVLQVVENNLDGLNWLVELLVDAQSLLIESMLFFFGNCS